MKKTLGRIKIPSPTPSGNRIRKMHWSAYRRLRNQLTTFIRLEAGSKEIPKCKPGEFRTVTITRYGARILDYDNLVFGAKPLVDSLRLAELIEDDNPQCVNVRYKQTAVPKIVGRYTMITIKEGVSE